MAVRIGVIGLGIGRTHLQHFRALDGVEIAAVADVDGELAAQLGARYGAKPYADGVAMMAAERLDAVSVCTPPRSHAPLVVAAARRGLHVLCEKPMAPTLADCDAMIEATQKAGVTLMLGFKKRYAPAYSFLKEREPEWGPPRIALCRYQLGPVAKGWFWDEADGGGPLVENTAHCLDVLRYLFGDARTVYAETSNQLTTSGPGPRRTWPRRSSRSGSGAGARPRWPPGRPASGPTTRASGSASPTTARSPRSSVASTPPGPFD